MKPNSTQQPSQQSRGQSKQASGKRKPRNVFHILLAAMISFGICMGSAFPIFTKLYFDDPKALTIKFTLMCIGAGMTVGIANYILFSLVVSKQLRFLVEGMNSVNEQIRTTLFSRKHKAKHYALTVKTEDIIGEVAMAFNTMSETVEQRFTHEAEFRDIISALSATVDLNKISEIILRYFVNTSHISSGLLYGKIEDDMILLASHNLDTDHKLPRKLETWQGIISETIDSGGIHSIDIEAGNFDWIATTTPFGTLKPKAIHLIPLVADKSTVGLVIAVCGPNNVPEEIQLQTLETYASYMAPYLQNALLHNKIQEMASYDSLTHVLNRRFGLVRLDEEFSTALRHQSDLSAIMIDIDKFKRVNDTFGHEAGDMVLKNIASTIAINLRNEEVICRYGGEEFLVILPMANLHKAGLVAERLRRMIEQQSSHYKDTVILATISLGVSSLSSLATQNLNELINTADTALYHAKHSGRNQVALFRNNEAILLPREI
jgi:diguanylate cyclase (GGDEF)-like protein